MKLLVTAGPTREAIDPVRFISNRSSGKMGYAVASAAAGKGHEVRLISGPAAIEVPEGISIVTRVVSATEMLAAVHANVDWCDALVMSAAVADMRPAETSSSKIKKDGSTRILKLEPTEDILLSIAPLKHDRVFVGFAAETERLEENARQKLEAKGLDLIIANDVSATDAGFEVDTNRVSLIERNGSIEKWGLQSKSEIADRIVKWLEDYISSRRCQSSS
jgi:phosphopantothenoylcysteine decarboxylase/phosphopantothenate--cysteine ligase